jgi:hypothetical protein
MRPYRPDHYLIVQSRQHYALYGVQSDPHYHARLEASPLFPTRGAAQSWLADHLTITGLYQIRIWTDDHTGIEHTAPLLAMERSERFNLPALPASMTQGVITSTMPNGHFAGAEGVRCSYGCSERMRMTTFGLNAIFRHYSFHGAPSPPRIVNSVMDALDTREPNVPHIPPWQRTNGSTPLGEPRPTFFPTFFPTRTPPDARPAQGILSVGVELECEFPRQHLLAIENWVSGMRREGCDMHTDGSIDVTQAGHIARELTFWSTDMAEIESFLTTMYDTFEARTNNSMGFHIHVKPNDELTWAFATRGYWEGFYAAYGTYAREADILNRRGRGKFASRPSGDWCRMQPYSLDYVVGASSHEGSRSRYVCINLESLVKHNYGTIEHRIMPHQSTSEEAIRSVRWLVQTSSNLITSNLDYEQFDLPTPYELPNAVETEVYVPDPVWPNETVSAPSAGLGGEVELISHPRLVVTEEV